MELRVKKNGIMISLWLNGVNGNIILAPGLPQHFDKYHPFVKQAERLGLNLFIPKYSGTYESEGDFNMKNSIKTVEKTIRLVKEGVAKELYADKEIKWVTKNIILFGFSYGALPVVLQKEKVEKIVLVCPFIFPEFHIEEKCKGENIKVTFQFLEKAYKNIYRINSKRLLRELTHINFPTKKKKMIFLFGKEDTTISLVEISKIKEHYKNSEFILKEGKHSIEIKDDLMVNLCNTKNDYYNIYDFINFTKELSLHNPDKLNSGNSSIRLSKNTFAIKPNGLKYDELTPENISIVNLNGIHLSGLKPSSDLKIHLAIYRSRKDINCIIHTHSHYAIVMSALNKPLYPLSTLQADYFGGKIPCVKYINHRKYNIATEILKLKGKVFLLEKHGTLIMDQSPKKAIKEAVILEEIAKINFDLKLIKGQINLLKTQDIKILNKYYNDEYNNQ